MNYVVCTTKKCKYFFVLLVASYMTRCIHSTDKNVPYCVIVIIFYQWFYRPPMAPLKLMNKIGASIVFFIFFIIFFKFYCNNLDVKFLSHCKNPFKKLWKFDAQKLYPLEFKRASLRNSSPFQVCKNISEIAPYLSKHTLKCSLRAAVSN